MLTVATTMMIAACGRMVCIIFAFRKKLCCFNEDSQEEVHRAQHNRSQGDFGGGYAQL